MRLPWAAACLALVFTACSDELGPADAAARDAASSRDASGGADDAAASADAAPARDGSVDARGFDVRVPQRRTIPCMAGGAGGCPSPTVEEMDVDFVCTLDHGARRGHFLYVQSTPVRLDASLGLVPLPIYTRDGSFLSDGTRVVAQDFGAIYDYGGGHHNDSLTVDLTDAVYRYYHSSFGFGFRRCQEMDCAQVYPPGGAAPSEDGCTRDRTLPIVCVRVAADGTVPPLTDTFMRCPGDT